jgi:NAD(P)-dependent dehydrogenase (short-subunit alcohol dehydrogenase family)
MSSESKVAVITGGGSGIGKAVSQILAGQNINVCVCDYNDENAKAVAAELRESGGKTSCWKMDVANSRNVADVFDQIREKIGPVDILVTSAGAPGHGLIDQISDDHWQNVINVNLNGVMYCMRESLKQMLPRRKGVIINISSICGIMGCANSPSYSASKAAVIGLSKSCARKHTSDGIRINVVAPGLVNTPFIEPNRKMGKLETDIAKIPMGRMGTATEIAELVAFLCSDAASYFSGQVISPNGGQLI